MQHMDVSGAVRILEAHPDYKVIRRLQLPVGALVEEMPEKTWSAAIVDVEATGFDVTTDEMGSHELFDGDMLFARFYMCWLVSVGLARAVFDQSAS